MKSALRVIAHLAKERPGELSQGEKQRAAIARAVVNRPDPGIADEQPANIDGSHAIEITRLPHELAQEEKRGCPLQAMTDGWLNLRSHDRNT